MEGSGLDTMEGEKGYPWVEQKKKRDAKRRKNMHTRNSIRIKMGKPIFFTLTHCSKKLKGISNRFNYKANMHNLCFVDASFL